MAIKAFLTTNDTVDYISHSDPAVDTENSDIKAYYEHLDASHLKFFPSQASEDAPTVFTLAPLSASDRGLALDSIRGALQGDPGKSFDYEIAKEFVRRSLKSVKNLYVMKLKDECKAKPIKSKEDYTSSLAELKLETIGDGRHSIQLAPLDVINHIPENMIRDLYAVIIMISHPTEIEKKS